MSYYGMEGDFPAVYKFEGVVSADYHNNPVHDLRVDGYWEIRIRLGDLECLLIRGWG